MADDLGARLVQAGLVTRDQLAAVLGAAPPNEGALVVGLVERGVSEDALAGFFVAEGFAVMEAVDLAGADPRAARRLAAGVATQLYALPVRLGPAGLVVAMAAPTDLHAVRELARAARSDILPTVARAGQLHRALRAAYPEAPPTARPTVIEPEPPVLDLVRRRPSRDGVDRPRADGGARAGDDAVVPLVRHKPVSERLALAARPRVITRKFEPLRAAPDPGVVPVGDGAPTARPQSPRRAPLPSPPAEAAAEAPSSPSPKSIIPPEHARWDLDEPLDRSGQRARARLVGAVPPPRAAPASARDFRPSHSKHSGDSQASRRVGSHRVTRPPRPASIGAALSAIRASGERDEVIELACTAALTVARAAVLLALRKNVLKGAGGAGGGLSWDAVRNLWIPISSPSMFRAVLAEGTPYLGSWGTTAADGIFRAAVGSRGGSVVIQPIAVGGKRVAALAADDLRFGLEGAERIEVIAHAVGEALERIIVSGKKR